MIEALKYFNDQPEDFYRSLVGSFHKVKLYHHTWDKFYLLSVLDWWRREVTK